MDPKSAISQKANPSDASKTRTGVPLHQATQEQGSAHRSDQRRYPSTLANPQLAPRPADVREPQPRRAPDAPDSELAKVVAKHFEATPVDEEAIVARFFEHLDDVDAARAGENDTGVARVHEQVAAKVSTTDENGSWILASVVRYDATSDAYAVQDEDDQKILELPASRIRRLGVADDNLDELQKGERVVAIFPETTSFYRAMVSKAPKRGPGGSPPREVVLKFEDDEDDSGRTPHRRVSLRYVLRERPQAKAPRPPPDRARRRSPEHGAPAPERPCRRRGAPGARPGPTKQWRRPGRRRRRRAARRRDLQRHDRPRPQEAARRAWRLQGRTAGHRAGLLRAAELEARI